MFNGNFFYGQTLICSTLLQPFCSIAATMILKLDENNLREACIWLSQHDEHLALVLNRHGYPPLWARTPGFSTLVHIILEQQVSLASANAAFFKLRDALGDVTPEGLLSLNEDTFRTLGFSRQKTRYAVALAEAVVSGSFRFDQLETLSDDAVRKSMTVLPGIGIWTADIYLSECLLRPDILPRGDIAMQEAFRELKGLSQRPVHDALEAQTQHWRPWRSVGSRLLWHHYLSERGRKNTIGV